jgi:hypothetical protein
VVQKQESATLDAITKAQALRVEMSEREHLAYDLYSASFFQPIADGRFLMLMMALETLIEQQPRSTEVATFVDQLITLTRNAGLPANEIKSILGSLEWLFVESVSQAGRRLVSSLGERRYMDELPAKFFTRCYDIRSKLVHGSHPRPERAEVDLRAATLEIFVGHLLGLPLLDEMSD